MKKNKFLLIGWDAADWKVINELMDKGLMPTLKKFVEEGVSGNLATMDPPYSPMLWTSIATGKYAFEHGVHGFTEVLSNGQGIRPISTNSRKVKAVWNILNQNNYKSNVISWWPSQPVEPINGVMVSNLFMHASKPLGKPWPLLDRSVHPESMVETVEELRLHPAELTGAHILPFIPNAANINPKEDKSYQAVVKILAQCSSVHNVATHVMEETEWDFMAVYHDAIDHFGHSTMKFRAPKLKGIPDEKHENYKGVIDAGYRFHDMMLERMLDLVDDETTVMLISDHGFHSDHLRPVRLPKEPAAPALEHREYGIFAIRGPGIKKNEKVYGATLLDIAPTILHWHGLAVGEDMHGKVLQQVFENPTEVKYVPSWEEIMGDDGRLPDFLEDQFSDSESLEQLVELGYIEKPDENTQKAVETTLNEGKYNISRSYLDAGKTIDGIRLLTEIRVNKPQESRYAFTLVNAYLKIHEYKKAQEVLNSLEPNKENETKIEFYKGLTLLSMGKLNLAIEKLEKIVSKNPQAYGILSKIASAYSQKELYGKAIYIYEMVLRINPDHIQTRIGIGQSLMAIDKYEDALDHLFHVTNLTYFNPKAHILIGESFYRLGFKENAIQAFEVADSMAPKLLKSKNWLIQIYEELDQPEKASQIKESLPNPDKEIIVVSGLPRSGTSMMMQMLEAAGLNILTDGKREADDSNPKGYFEYEPVKKLAFENSWMPEAEGKVVKIVSPLLPALPVKHKYKIIHMNREISEVLISQQIMLGKSREQAIMNYPFKMAETFHNQLRKVKRWSDNQPNLDWLEINHKDIINEPEAIARKIGQFLDREFDIEKMAQVVDKKLHRNRTEPA